jgi:galactose mutarotase-like enzyme
MAIKTWTILDHPRHEFRGDLAIGPGDIDASIATHFRIAKRTLRGGLSDRVDVIEVDNGRVTFTVLPTRGMGIGRLSLNAAGDIGWHSPIRGPVHPQFVNLADPSGLGWLDGFDEFLCRCGLESNGAPHFDDKGHVKYPLHGKIANRPAHRVEIGYDTSAGEIIITGEASETRFLVQNLRLTTTIRTKPGELALRIRDEVTNDASTSATAQLLYHINFGGTLLDAGSKVVAPVKTLVPRNDHAAKSIERWDHYAAAEPGFAEQVYLFELLADANGRTRSLLRNAHGTLGASVLFDTKQLPCFTLWKNTGALSDGYVTGLEPGTNYPNPRSFEEKHGRVIRLKPGETRAFDVAIELHPDQPSVRAAEAEVQKLQASAKSTIHPAPQPTWCA